MAGLEETVGGRRQTQVVCSIHYTQVTTHSGGFQICGISLEVRFWTMTQHL